MKRITIMLLGACFFLTGALNTFADDTEIYGTSNQEIQPNVLIVFDNSGSMNGTVAVTVLPYDPAIDYSSYGSYEKDAVYRRFFFWWSKYINNLSSVSCTAAYDALSTNGQWTGRLGSNGTCGGRRRVFATGNYLNYLQGPGDATKSKLEIAKEVITGIIQNTNGVRFGTMIFNESEGGRISKEIKDMDEGTNRQDLIDAINAITGDTWTPLGETLYEAGLYYQGAASYFNSGVNYTTPIQYACQKNYVIVMTDGESTQDINAILSSAVGDTDGDGNDPGSYSSDGSDYLDDVAKKWYDEDLLPSSHVSGAGKQNLITYTIGFNIDDQLLQDTADNGKGEYYTADTAQELTQAFLGVLGSILEDDTSFVAPVVPVSPENRTFSGDFVYLGFFKPGQDAFWSGNLKKYKLEDGVIVDADGDPATNPDGSFDELSRSYWSISSDGGKVEKGGAGEVLLLQKTLEPADFDPAAAGVRKIYTYLGVNSDLKHTTNQFEISNAAITPVMLGLSVGDNAGKDKLIRFIHGEDAYNGSTMKRDWIFGDVLHSGPVVIHYSNTRSVIYIGADDGMLHALEDATGDELWGYIPASQLAFLNNLTGTLHPYFVDGSPKAYVLDANDDGQITTGSSGDKVILIFGERRGGDSYHAIDVTDPDNPEFLWDVSSSDAGFGELGQTWASPNIAKVKIGGSTKNVFFVGGGYDAVNEDAEPPTADTNGRAVYAIEVETGDKIWEYSYSNDSSLSYSIPSDVTALDIDQNGYTDRLYVGDVGGRVWRFDVGNDDTVNWTGRILFASNPGADASSGRKILYPPDVVQEMDKFTGATFEYLYFGTGDRAHPLNTTATVDRIYAVKDYSDPAVLPLTENNLVDVTENALQLTSTTAEEINTILTALDTEDGWYIKLDQNSGEKVVSRAVVFNKAVSISTFEPVTSGGPIDPCLANVGVGRTYSVNYLTGEAVLNFDQTNDGGYESETNERALGNEGDLLKRSDRTQVVGSGIPSEIVIEIPESGGGACDAYALVGTGGGVDILPVECGGTFIRIFWREIFDQ